MKSKDFTLLNIGPQLSQTLQLYVSRPAKVNEILKPISGPTSNLIWTSTAKKYKDSYTSDWVEWCKNEMPQWLSKTGTLYKVMPGARVLSMNTDKDAYKIAKNYGINPPKDLFSKFMWAQNFPWDDIKKDFDAIHHNPTGSRSENILMSSWDVESTVWFNTKYLHNLGKVKI